MPDSILPSSAPTAATQHPSKLLNHSKNGTLGHVSASDADELHLRAPLQLCARDEADCFALRARYDDSVFVHGRSASLVSELSSAFPPPAHPRSAELRRAALQLNPARRPLRSDTAAFVPLEGLLSPAPRIAVAPPLGALEESIHRTLSPEEQRYVRARPLPNRYPTPAPVTPLKARRVAGLVPNAKSSGRAGQAMPVPLSAMLDPLSLVRAASVRRFSKPPRPGSASLGRVARAVHQIPSHVQVRNSVPYVPGQSALESRSCTDRTPFPQAAL
jgi:hypothetical protein